MGSEFRPSLIAECPDFYGKTEPWVIWERYGGEDGEALHLFAQRHRLHGNAKRFDRKVGSGTWSAQYSREEFEIADKDVTVLCTLRQNPKRTTTSSKKRRNVAVLKKKHTLDDDQKNKAKRLRIEQPAATTSSETMVVNCSNSDPDDNAEFTRRLQVVLAEETSISSMDDVTLNASLGESLGGTASGLGFSCVDQQDIYSTLPSIIDPTLFDFTDNANADSFSPMQSHNSSIDVDCQALASYSSLLSSPVNFDDLLCDATQFDDAGMSSFVSDDNILCDATHDDNAGSSHAQSTSAIDGQDLSNQFEESYSDYIGDLESSFDDVYDHYLLQSQVIDDDQEVTIID